MRMQALGLSLLLALAAGGAVAAVPARQGDVYVWADGTRVRATDPAGRAGSVQSDGSIRWADGTQVRHDLATGETRITHADGRVEVTSANAPRREGDTFVWSDGTRVRARDPAGREGQVKDGGWVVFQDGTRVSHDVRSGDTKMVHADGRVDVIPGGGPRRDESGNFVWSDGTRIRGSDDKGNPGRIGADGSVTYADGTRATHDTRSGDTKFVSPDGTVRLINRGTGTDKTFPPAGSTSGGSHSNTGSGGTAGTGDPNANSSGRSNTSAGSAGTANTQAAGHSSNSNNSNTSSNSNNSSGSGNSNGGSNSNSGKEPAKDTAAQDAGKGKDKARTHQDWGPRPGGAAPTLRVGGLAGTPNDARDGSARPAMTAPGGRAGPGARPGGAGTGPAALLRLPARSLVINPSPGFLESGPGTPRPIDPFGGRR